MARSAAQAQTGPGCTAPGCENPIEQTPGKRRRMYCSDACRMRVKRLLKAGEKPTTTTGRGGTSPAKTNARLGTTGKTTDTQVRGPFPGEADPKRDADLIARDGRYALREDLREKGVTRVQSLAECGCRVLAGGVTPILRAGRAGFAGLVTCGSVHICPVCGTTIRAARRDELDSAGVAWEEDHGGLVMMTLTMRHFARQSLQGLADQQRDAWRLSFGQNAGRAWRQAKTAFELEGYVRAWEVVHGPNGWHVHYHVLLFMTRPWTRDQVQEFQHLAFGLWSAALERVGAYLPIELGEDGEPIGVRVDAPDRGEYGDVARYLMKGQDGKTEWGVAAEMTRADAKAGGKSGYRTPFEIARAAVLDGADPNDIRLWREFEAGAKGIRALYWSNGLRAKLAALVELDERTDGEIAADVPDGDRLALIPAATWYRHVIRHRGRSLALLRAAERLGKVGIRTLIESWGLVWGVDVLEPEEPTAEAGQTAAEVLRQTERAHQADRQEFWRQSFDRLKVEEASRKRAATPGETPDMAARRAALARQRVEAARAEADAASTRVELERAAEQFQAARRAANAARADDLQEALERVRARG